jgi:TolB-like protein/Flp pilus assembly protein TadD/DNA-binding winged helix-turn-helix (wHTH) protein
MDAASLQVGFRVGDWLIQPREARATAPDGRLFELSTDQVELLLALAERHGEAVDRRALRERIWPRQAGSEEKLRRTVASLRAMFGDSARTPRCIASFGREAYALIAHFQLLDPPAPDPPALAVDAADSKGGQRASSRLHWLLGELRRRSVVKVAASYLVGMWIVLQVAEVTFEPLRFPEWWMTALTILAVLGLPIVVSLAWMYEITPAGVVVDAGIARPGVNLPRPRQSLAGAIVAGVALMSGVTGFAWLRSLEQEQPPAQEGTAAPDGAPSVAVLPLVDMSPGGGNDYLGEGLSEELSTRLAQVPGLRVAARTSAFEFKGRNLDVRRIGQQLGVNHVLEGSVRRQGDVLRVTVQLIDARTGYHVWAGNFDRAWRDVLSMQDDIARSVTDALQIVFADAAGADSGAMTAVASVDATAIEPYLRGLAGLRQPADPSRIVRVVQDFEQAVSIAPGFAAAHAGLCRALARRFDISRDPQALSQAQLACRKALELDPSLIETEKALAGLYVSDGKFEQAVTAFRKLAAANPVDADVHIGLGEALAGLERGEEAEASFRRAVAVEPAFWSAHAALAHHLFQRGRIAEATEALRKVAELVPSSAAAWSNLGGALQMQGDFDAARRAYGRSLQLEPSQNAYSNLATTQFYLGHFGDAVASFERAVALGERDQTIRGNLADALWQLPDRRADAVATYRKAIELAEQELGSTPDDPMLKAQLGYYYGRTGEAGRAQKYLAEAARSGGDRLYVQYYLGVAAADRGDRETALAAVEQLVKLGYPTALLRSAPEFRSLLQDPQYKRIIGSA